MFDVNELYELLKTNDVEDIFAEFKATLDEASERRKQEVYKFGTHELPTDWYTRLDTNDTTLEDVVLLMYAVLYRDYPNLRNAMEHVDIAGEAKSLTAVIDVINNPKNQLQKVFDSLDIKDLKTTQADSKSTADKAAINNFLKFFY